jgi:hypothetical protein
MEVTVDEVGGFSILFENGSKLETFPPNCSDYDSEHWRLFRPDKEEQHYVFTKMAVPPF